MGVSTHAMELVKMVVKDVDTRAQEPAKTLADKLI